MFSVCGLCTDLNWPSQCSPLEIYMYIHIHNFDKDVNNTKEIVHPLSLCMYVG